MRKSIIFLYFVSTFSLLVVANNMSAWATTEPIADNPFEQKTVENFNFAVAGDFGCDNNVSHTIASIVRRDPELVIALGDLSYSKSPQCWRDIVRPLDDGSRLKISIGEHDIKNKLILYREYMKQFNLVNPFYTFDYQNVHFLAMATAKNRIIPYNVSSAQYRFII